uniref:Uncharacterized protein n=1 Tax=Oryza glumipatula TaxID=40148 RepID=A0A0D9Z9B6_9ORYZ
MCMISSLLLDVDIEKGMQDVQHKVSIRSSCLVLAAAARQRTRRCGPIPARKRSGSGAVSEVGRATLNCDGNLVFLLYREGPGPPPTGGRR